MPTKKTLLAYAGSQYLTRDHDPTGVPPATTTLATPTTSTTWTSKHGSGAMDAEDQTSPKFYSYLEEQAYGVRQCDTESVSSSQCMKLWSVSPNSAEYNFRSVSEMTNETESEVFVMMIAVQPEEQQAPRLDMKYLEKPGVFDGRETSWGDWKFRMLNWFGAIDAVIPE